MLRIFIILSLFWTLPSFADRRLKLSEAKLLAMGQNLELTSETLVLRAWDPEIDERQVLKIAIGRRGYARILSDVRE